MAAPSSTLERQRASLPSTRRISGRAWLDARARSEQKQGRLLALVLALASTGALADVLLGDSVILIGLQVLAPLIAAATIDVRRTAVVAAYALVLASVLGYSNDIFGSVDHGSRLLTVALGGALSVWTARLRGRSDAQRERAEGAELSARESEERFRALVDGVEDYAIYSIDEHGLVASWNSGAERLHGYRREEITGVPIGCFYTLEDVAAGKPEQALSVAEQEGRFEEEGWRVRKDASRFYAEAVTTLLRDDSGHMRGYARVTRDVTERKRLESQLAHQAFHDSMTGLPNRRLFLDRVAGALARSERREGSAAVLFFDLDRFKAVNDTLGHAAGDELLLGVAARLRAAVRGEDTVARFGGDEFAVLCEELAERHDAITVAERIGAALAVPFEIDGTMASMSASVGMAFAGARHTPDALLQEADAAMYRAKERGDGLAVVFDESFRPHKEQATDEADLRRALDRGELRLVYQPLVDLRTGTVTGVEALVRWAHPERGLLRAAEFMELAEEPELATHMGAWVLREACSQLGRWSDEAPDSAPLVLSLAVNLSARQLPQPELPELVADVLAETGIDPATLSLEISERDLVAHPRSTTALFALRGLGVRLAVDDFGTGYSSLSLLKRLSVDSVKIAAPFVEGLGRRSEDSTLVAAMISMARSLGVTTVAEAVETRAQLEELRALGCDRAQGYLFARPALVEDLPDALRVSRLALAAA